MSRREKIIIGEYYHIFNRGVEKRKIFNNKNDYFRFCNSMIFLNTEKPSKMSFDKFDDNERPSDNEMLVDIVAYCLNSNHFHCILKEKRENGIATFIKKVCTSHAMYFNKKYERSGVLFQGRFKSVHIDSNDLLLYLSAYVNCNSQVHKIEDAEKYPWCSFPEYLGGLGIGCQKSIILDQFKSSIDYKTFCLEKVDGMISRKDNEKLCFE
ncbi:MAG: transposase [Parcubacteria group bacterium]|jgi:REP element-mobilizing transposase RayT